MLHSKPKFLFLLPILITACFFILHISLHGQTETIRQLLPDQTFEREMTGAEAHRYLVKLKKSEVIAVKVEQNSSNITLKLLDSGGNTIITSDAFSDVGILDKEPKMLYVATSDTSYIIEVEFPKDGIREKTYQITRGITRESTDDLRISLADYMLKSAEKSVNEANDIFKELQTTPQKQLENSFSVLLRRSITQYKEASYLYDGTEKDVYRILCYTQIGINFRRLGDISNSLIYLKDALELTKKKNLYGFLPSVINEITRIYFAEGQEEVALEYLYQLDLENLDNWKGNEENLRQSLDLLSDLYASLGDVEDYEKSIAIFNKLIDYFSKQPIGNFKYDDKLSPEIYKDFYLQSLYTGLGKAYTEAGYYFEAINANEKGLKICISLQERLKLIDIDEAKKLIESAASSESNFRNNIGIDYLRTGNLDTAEKYIKDALNLAIKLDESLYIVKWKANLAGVYARQKKFDIAIKGFDETIPELKKLRKEYFDRFKKSKDISDRLQEVNLAAFVGIDLYYYGTILRQIGKFKEAINYHKESIQFLSEYKFRKFEARARTELGLDYLAINKQELAEEEFKKAYLLAKFIKARDEQAVALDGLMRAWQDRDINQAIFYGKQSVNMFQNTRTELHKIGKNIASEFLKDNIDTYRRLADILITQGRIAEAEQVLEMLKEEEYFSYLRRDEKVANKLNARISLSEDEKKAFETYAKVADDITRTAREFEELKKKIPVGKTFESLAADEQVRYKELENKYNAAVAEFNKFLDELKITFSQKEDKTKIIAQVESVTQNLLRGAKEPHTVIISTIVGEDRLNLIVTTTDVQTAHTVNISAENLNKLVAEYRIALTNPKIDPRTLGKKLYDTLFPAALQKDLANIGADTIVWSLDGTLRYVPMATLWDGERYLVERYNQAVINLASLNKLDYGVDRKKWRAFAVGVSKPFENFSELPAVPKELCNVVSDPDKKEFCGKFGESGVFDGVMLKDEEFTFDRFQPGFDKLPLVHIASHFALNAGDYKDSYLLLGGGANRRFSLANLETTRLDGVELLTLSACNTAMTSANKSNGLEVEGFGAFAQKQGVKSVLATLWAVADDSTGELMTEFYNILENEPDIGKAEALRKAQLELIRGEYKTPEEAIANRSELVNSSGSNSNQPPFKKDDKAPFAHPFYWSPFVLIGNWR